MFSTKKIKTVLELISIAISLGVTISPLAVVAQTQQSNDQINQTASQIENSGLPTNRRDGGSRGSCDLSDRSGFVALVPETGINLTSSATPKLYFHVPEIEQARTLELVLRDSADRLVYEQFFTVSGESGIMSIEIPLSINQKSQSSETIYHWYLSSICNPQNRSQDIVLEGWLGHQRVSEMQQQTIASLSNPEKFAFYSKQGFWHDSLEVATQNKTQWQQLLTEIGLVEFVDTPFIEQ